jgi:hypothetical protein
LENKIPVPIHSFSLLNGLTKGKGAKVPVGQKAKVAGELFLLFSSLLKKLRRGEPICDMLLKSPFREISSEEKNKHEETMKPCGQFI